MQELSLLIKPASGNCNMRCQYCFYANVSDSREVKNKGMMTLEVLEQLVQQTLSEVTDWCTFGFQGGEPMLAGRDFFEQLIVFQQKYNVHGTKIENSIQTNGTLIDEAWARFFHEHRFLVGLSVDGSKDVHDRLRPDSQGSGTFDTCMRAAALLTEYQVDVNILTVLTEDLAADPERLYHFYKQYDFRYIQLIPCIDDLHQRRGSNRYSLQSETYGRFLMRFFDLWYADFIAGHYYSVRSFDNYVQMLMGRAPDNCAMSGRCQSYPVVEADGSVYPCDFYALDEYQIGQLGEATFAQMLTSATSQQFMQPASISNTACTKCEYQFICRGGCRRDREAEQPGALALNYYCQAYKQFFAHALPRMKDIAYKMSR